MKILGPVPCIACGKPVWWDRTDVHGATHRLVLMEGAAKHVCEVVGKSLSKAATAPRRFAA